MNVRHVQSFGGLKRPTTICLIPVLAVLFTFYSQCQGQQASAGSVVPADPNIRWALGPQKRSLGDYADIDIPAGYRMTDAQGARIILDSFNSPVPLNLIGALSDTAGKWWSIVEYSPKGFVKDGDQINSDTVLKALQAEMKDAGQPNASLNWKSAPVYDSQMHSLSWSLEAQNASKTELNQTIVLLGRRGFVTIVSYQANPDANALSLKQLAASINFKDGEGYADFQSGDQVARLGLSDLIVGEKHVAKAATGHGFAGSSAALVYSGIFVCVVVGGVMLLRMKKASSVSRAVRPTQVAAPATPAVAAKPSVPAPATAAAAVAGNGHQNGASSVKVPEQKKQVKQFHRNRRKKIFNYPKFYTNVMRELSLHSYGPGHYSNGKSNGHANGHLNGASNGHANGNSNGHANGHANGDANGSNGLNEAIKSEIAALIANQKNLIEEQKCLLEQQTKLIAEKRWLIEEQSAFLKGQSEQQFPLKFE